MRRIGRKPKKYTIAVIGTAASWSGFLLWLDMDKLITQHILESNNTVYRLVSNSQASLGIMFHDILVLGDADPRLVEEIKSRLWRYYQ